MAITILSFRANDSGKECLRIKVTEPLTGTEAPALRRELMNSLRGNHDVFYLDLIDVNQIDLSGINETINFHYQLKQISKKLVLEYQANSSIAKWVDATRLDRFITTTISPAR